MERLITAMLIEDDSQARSMLQKFLEVDEKVFVVASLDSTLQAEEIITKNKPDVLFLDIHLPYEDGILFATRLRESGFETLLVFTTAFRNYALEAFKLKPFDFLEKPFGINEISNLIHKIEKHIESKELTVELVSNQENSGKFKFRTKKGYLFLLPNEIVYVKSTRNYCELFLTSGTVEKISLPISIISKEIVGSNFRLINRSLIINLNYIVRVDRKLKKCVLGYGQCELEIQVTNKNLGLFEKLNTLKLG